MWHSNDMFHYILKAEFVTLVRLKVPSGRHVNQRDAQIASLYLYLLAINPIIMDPPFRRSLIKSRSIHGWCLRCLLIATSFEDLMLLMFAVGRRRKEEEESLGWRRGREKGLRAGLSCNDAITPTLPSLILLYESAPPCEPQRMVQGHALEQYDALQKAEHAEPHATCRTEEHEQKEVTLTFSPVLCGTHCKCIMQGFGLWRCCDLAQPQEEEEKGRRAALRLSPFPLSTNFTKRERGREGIKRKSERSFKFSTLPLP